VVDVNRESAVLVKKILGAKGALSPVEEVGGEHWTAKLSINRFALSSLLSATVSPL
jgi:hypothetical protein